MKRQPDRQSTNYIYLNKSGRVAIEWITDDPTQQLQKKTEQATPLAFFEIALELESDIPDSLKGFRK